MIHLSFGAEDLARIRFAFSPLWEAVLSLRTLSTGGAHGLHTPWVRLVGARLHRSRGGTAAGAPADGDVPAGLPPDLDLLFALVRPAGYIPDFLQPVPAGRTSSFGSELDRLAGTDPGILSAELTHLAGHRLAQQGPDQARRVALLHRLAADPPAALAGIVTALDRYWQLAVAPYWPRIEALLQADLSWRLDQLAGGGLSQLLRTLHPQVSFAHGEMRIVKYYEGRADLGGRGLLLVPSVFAWPDVVVRTADPQPIVTYPPRGIGRLWDRTPGTSGGPLGEVLGHSRAAILRQLDLPMSTTQLAGLLDLTPATLNAHLKALQGAGILSARRAGRAVLYSRTSLGESMATTAGQRDR
ncbi:MAG TPA: DUF5937 family protein [Micromonosporaceae bacterium]